MREKIIKWMFVIVPIMFVLMTIVVGVVTYDDSKVVVSGSGEITTMFGNHQIITIDKCEYIESQIYCGAVLAHKANCTNCLKMATWREK
jgi:hypothetical protein